MAGYIVRGHGQRSVGSGAPRTKGIKTAPATDTPRIVPNPNTPGWVTLKHKGFMDKDFSSHDAAQKHLDHRTKMGFKDWKEEAAHRESESGRKKFSEM